MIRSQKILTQTCHCEYQTNQIPRFNQVPRFNSKKAKWENFTKNLDNKIASIETDLKNYEAFQKLVWEVGKKKFQEVAEN